MVGVAAVAKKNQEWELSEVKVLKEIAFLSAQWACSSKREGPKPMLSLSVSPPDLSLSLSPNPNSIPDLDYF